jgi:TPR repeat protein
VRGAVAAQEGGVIFAAAAAAHVATEGERAGCRRGSVEQTLAVVGLSKLAKGWRKGEIKGNAEDQFRLAICHYTGTEGAKLDKVAAAAWYGKAAEQEHAVAQRELATCYVSGEGVDQSLEVGVQWYLRAADLGGAVAQTIIGNCYAIGKGVEQDDAQAMAWWEKSAKGVVASSQHALGKCYMHGTHGLPKNTRRARSFLKAAAAQGDARAIEDLKLLNACESCGAPDANRTCGGCKSVKGIRVARYCTLECQTKDWKFHKLDSGGLNVCECRNCRVSDRGESSTFAAAT